MKLDKSLAVWHGLADKGLKGFKWKERWPYVFDGHGSHFLGS